MGISDPDVRKKLTEARYLQYKHLSETGEPLEQKRIAVAEALLTSSFRERLIEPANWNVLSILRLNHQSISIGEQLPH
jgi:hypothetical protein